MSHEYRNDMTAAEMVEEFPFLVVITSGQSIYHTCGYPELPSDADLEALREELFDPEGEFTLPDLDYEVSVYEVEAALEILEVFMGELEVKDSKIVRIDDHR